MTWHNTVRQQRVCGLYSSCLHICILLYNFEKLMPSAQIMMQELRREAIATLLTEATTVGQH